MRIPLTSRRQHVLDKDEDSFLSTQFDPFPDHINKLPHSQISRNKISVNHRNKGDNAFF